MQTYQKKITDAIEGECNGIAINVVQANNIIHYMFSNLITQSPFITCISNAAEKCYSVNLRFETLQQAQDFHEELVLSLDKVKA